MTTLENTSAVGEKSIDSHCTDISALAVRKGILDIKETMQNLVDHSFYIDERLFPIVFEEVRSEEIFENYSIDPDGAIQDLVTALKSGSFVEVARLARGNETVYEGPNEESYYVDAFEAYVKVLHKFGFTISSSYLQQLA